MIGKWFQDLFRETECVPVKGMLEIPSNKPDAERILRVSTKPKVDQVKVAYDKILVKGTIKIGVEYVAWVPGDSQPVHFASFREPFAACIECYGARPGMSAKVDVDVERQNFDLTGPRTIKYWIVLGVRVVDLDRHYCDRDRYKCDHSDWYRDTDRHDDFSKGYSGDDYSLDRARPCLMPWDEEIRYDKDWSFRDWSPRESKWRTGPDYPKYCPHCGEKL